MVLDFKSPQSTKVGPSFIKVPNKGSCIAAVQEAHKRKFSFLILAYQLVDKVRVVLFFAVARSQTGPLVEMECSFPTFPPKSTVVIFNAHKCGFKFFSKA